MSDYERIRAAIAHYENLARQEYGANFVQHANAHFQDMQRKYYSATENPDYGLNITRLSP